MHRRNKVDLGNRAWSGRYTDLRWVDCEKYKESIFQQRPDHIDS